jgi:hypothetical protein
MSSKSLSLVPTADASTTVIVLHVEPADHAALRSEALAFAGALADEDLLATAVLDGRDRRRVAVYLQWSSAERARSFLDSPTGRDLERTAAALGARGRWRAYALPHVADSRRGRVTDLSVDYRGVTVINEVLTTSPQAQPELTRIMVRTGSVTRLLPFHHAVNLHTSTDGTTNLNVLQFRSNAVRVLLWFILRFGRTTEALAHGTPDVHFYDVLVARTRRAARDAVGAPS